MNTLSRRFALAVPAVALLLATGCDRKPAAEVDDGSVWIQQSMVAVKAADFGACVRAAAAKVEGLAVDEATSKPELITLKTALAEKIPGLRAEIAKNEQGLAELRFIGHGKREPDEARVAIAPVLKVLAESVAGVCNEP